MQENKDTTKIIPLIPLRGLVLYPETLISIDLGRESSIAALEYAVDKKTSVLFTAQKDIREEQPGMEGLYPVGTIAKVRQAIRIPGDVIRILVEGEKRARLLEISTTEEGVQMATAVPFETTENDDPLPVQAMMRLLREHFFQHAQIKGDVSSDLMQIVQAETDPGKLSDLVALNTLSMLKDRQMLLATASAQKRLSALLKLLPQEIALIQLTNSLQDRVKFNLEENQKEYFLREQLNVIREELGDDEGSEKHTLARKLAESGMNEEARAQTQRELNRYGNMAPGTPEATVSRNYIETMLELPWDKSTKDHTDIKRARRVLDRDHYGLEEVKERILEFLAVGAIKGSLRGPILCLVGPPGVGKTSIAKSVAQALKRKFVRMSLGGLRDEAEIRGHRRTYIGAIPGRLINGLRKCGSLNPVFLLDEIDKMASDVRGDPASALLEALDPEQNAAFTDHYLEAPFDLSKVLFLTTANSLSGIPAPLLDRMEVIELSGYTQNEKLEIALRHLWPKQLKLHGLSKSMVRLNRKAVASIIDGYTRESGVRQLEQQLAKLCRRACMKLSEGAQHPLRILPGDLEDYLNLRKYLSEDLLREPAAGAVNGLAWTAYGGDTLVIEAAVMPGKGVVELTGSLGDVMKESARTAHSFLREQAPALNLPTDFFSTHDFHVHVPEGATPKDGPSAGVALYCAMASAATGRKARQDVAMTGEITLLGRLLPVGGIKEKLLAAHRMGIRTILLPKANERDLSKLPPDVRADLSVTLLAQADQALPRVLHDTNGGSL